MLLTNLCCFALLCTSTRCIFTYKIKSTNNIASANFEKKMNAIHFSVAKKNNYVWRLLTERSRTWLILGYTTNFRAPYDE